MSTLLPSLILTSSVFPGSRVVEFVGEGWAAVELVFCNKKEKFNVGLPNLFIKSAEGMKIKNLTLTLVAIAACARSWAWGLLFGCDDVAT